ncbi:hypothetical protein LLE49_19865 [Alicyclobacillus tolerans]|uniref:VirB4 family type IV secretion system protein n=1 Tax=Alicyclobacillus tolerans TaxID=90970 RepID=UPI001F2B6D9D|nr:hypothetical protein [Alicyclobacillus tolerans]MCF8566981.1 hypothetical protein [Alicyclobacillus tolerans]
MIHNKTKPKRNCLPYVQFDGDYALVGQKNPKKLAFYRVEPQIIQNKDVDELVSFLDQVADIYNKVPFSNFQVYARKIVKDNQSYIDFLQKKRKETDYQTASNILLGSIELAKDSSRLASLREFLMVFDITGQEDSLIGFERDLKGIEARKMTKIEIEKFLIGKVIGDFEGLEFEDIYVTEVKHERYSLLQQQVRIGSTFHKSYVINRFPRTKDTFFITDILNASGNFDVLFDFRKAKKDKIVQKLDIMLLNKENESVTGRASNRIKGKKDLEDTEKMLAQIAGELEQVWQVTTLIDVYDSSPKNLLDTESRLNGVLLTQGMKNTDLTKGIKSWIQTLPLCSVEKEVFSPYSYHFHSSLVSKLFPAFSSDYSDDTGVIAGENVDTGNLVVIDRLDRSKYPARNMSVFGLTGRGKTYAMETDILRHFSLGYKIIVLTPDRGYDFPSSICEKVTFGISYENSINPFQIDSLIVDSDDEKDKIGGELYFHKKVEDIISFLRTITTVSSTEAGLLETLITRLYEKYGYSKESVTVPNSFPTLQDLYQLALEVDELQDFCSELKSFAIGHYSHIFARNRNWGFDKPITVLDIKNLSDGVLRQIMMDALVKAIWEQVKTWDHKFIVYIDEAHQLTRDEKSIQFMTDLAKRIRKYGKNQGGAVFITQNPSDLLRFDGAENIPKNCDFLMIFPIKPDDIDQLKKIGFYPTKQQYKFLTSAKQHQAILKAGGTSVTIAVIRSDQEREVMGK